MCATEIASNIVFSENAYFETVVFLSQFNFKVNPIKNVFQKILTLLVSFVTIGFKENAIKNVFRKNADFVECLLRFGCSKTPISLQQSVIKHPLTKQT